MLRLLTIAALCSGSLLAHPHVEPPVEESSVTRGNLRGAKKITLSEGLPHPARETVLFKAESARKGIHKLADFHFYKPAIKPDKATTVAIRQLLATPSNLTEWKEKRCGGFHPDWAVSWSTGFRRKEHVLICFGCQQVIFITRDSQLRYDLKPEPFKTLRKLLTPLRQKRPKA